MQETQIECWNLKNRFPKWSVWKHLKGGALTQVKVSTMNILGSRQAADMVACHSLPVYFLVCCHLSITYIHFWGIGDTGDMLLSLKNK